MTIIGHRIKLTNDRFVFVGSSDATDLTYIAFRNAQGEETRLSLSPEAKDALVSLLVNHTDPMSVDLDQWVRVTGG